MGLLAASDTQRSDVRPLLSLGKILHPLITIVGKRRRDQLEKSSSIWLSIPPSTLISPPIRKGGGMGVTLRPKLHLSSVLIPALMRVRVSEA